MDETSPEEEVVRRMYAAFNRRDVEGVLAEFHPDLEFRPRIGSLEGAVFRGPAELRRWMTEMLPETYARVEAHPEGFVPGEDSLVVLIRNVAEGKSSGAVAEQEAAHLLRFTDGKISSFTAYADRAEALRAAGLTARPR